MKRVLMVLMVSLIVLGSVFASAAPEKSKVTVEIFQAKVEIKDQLESVAAKYMSKNPDVTINVTTVGGGEDWKASLQAKFLSGNAPDVFVVSGPQDCVDWLSKLADLSGTKCAANAYDTALADVTIDGKVYGVPFNMEGFGLIYNKGIFEKANIDAASINTWADLVAAVETLDSKKAELGLDAVFAQNCSQYQALSNMAATIFLSPELKSGKNTLEAKNLDFTYGSEFKAYIDLLQKYGIQPSLSVTYADQVSKYFCLGKVAIIPQGNWIYNTVKGMDENLAANMGVMGVPVDAAGIKDVYVNVPYYWVVNKESDAAVIKAATEFLDWLYTSDEGKDCVINELSFLPAYKGFENYKVNDPLSQDIYDYYAAGDSIPFIYNSYPAGFASEFADYIQAYIGGSIDWNTVISNAQASWVKLR